jgi:hypothetical protein
MPRQKAQGGKMSYWSHNPELLDEITIRALPDFWRDRIESGEIELEDVPEKIRDKAMLEGEQDYWASKIDYAYETMKDKTRP